MTNKQVLEKVFPKTLFIYQKVDNKTNAIMCSDEWLNAEYTDRLKGWKADTLIFDEFVGLYKCEGETK